MKLYSGPLSLFSAKVRIALREKALDCDLWSVPFCRETGYDPKPADVLHLHPQGLVPILVDDDGLVVYDSSQIFEYLEERNPTPPLYPSSLRERARCREIEAYADDVFFPNVWTLIEQVFYAAEPATESTGLVAKARTAIFDDYGRFEERLADREWFCDVFSVADISAFMGINFASNLGAPPTEGHTRLAGWLARMNSRPAVAAEVERMQADVARVFAGERLAEGPREL